MRLTYRIFLFGLGLFGTIVSLGPQNGGAGLGSSLAYDMVKAHQGEFLVESREGEYSEFILHLPLNN